MYKHVWWYKHEAGTMTYNMGVQEAREGRYEAEVTVNMSGWREDQQEKRTTIRDVAENMRTNTARWKKTI